MHAIAMTGIMIRLIAESPLGLTVMGIVAQDLFDDNQDTFEQQKSKLQQEILIAGGERRQAETEGYDVEAVLNFAERPAPAAANHDSIAPAALGWLTLGV
jgi:hypothetical protein